ncbi:MAG TPA: hypothetical protein VM165_22200 [Planctomycetaceae bacterium]|nr:hypothetical protein [Planctomycetaceae bacterium]
MKSVVAILAMFTVVPAYGDEPAVATSPRDAAIDGTIAWMTAYRELPHVSVWFDLDYEPLHGQPAYAWSHEQTDTRRQGEKLRTIPILTNHPSGELERRDTTWDGKVAMSRNPSADIVPRNIALSRNLHMWTLFYRNFDNFIFSPEGHARAREITGNMPVDKSDYWLPAALKRNRAEFVPSDSPEVVSDQQCIVLTRGRFDKFWIAPRCGHVVCQREVLIGKMFDQRERTTASDFKQIDGLWLPHKLVREVFVPGEHPNQWVLRDRKTLTVKLISTAPIADDEFRLPIPDGVTVFDSTK